MPSRVSCYSKCFFFFFFFFTWLVLLLALLFFLSFFPPFFLLHSAICTVIGLLKGLQLLCLLTWLGNCYIFSLLSLVMGNEVGNR